MFKNKRNETRQSLRINFQCVTRYWIRSHFTGTTFATRLRGEDPVGRALILALRWRELYKCTAIEWHEISPTLRIVASGALSSIKPHGYNLHRSIKCTLPITRDQLSYRGLMASTKSPVCKYTSAEVTPKESATILLPFLSDTKTHCPPPQSLFFYKIDSRMSVNICDDNVFLSLICLLRKLQNLFYLSYTAE